jgi:hypothetical protein
MLLSVTIETNKKRALEVGVRLINAEFWHAARTVETTKTEFKYPINYHDRRESPSIIKTTEAIATIRAAANLAPTTEAITLPVHNNNDPSAATTNLDFRTRDIVFGLNLPSDPTNKGIFYILSGGFKVNKYVVDNTIAEVIALVTA